MTLRLVLGLSKIFEIDQELNALLTSFSFHELRRKLCRYYWNSEAPCQLRMQAYWILDTLARTQG